MSRSRSRSRFDSESGRGGMEENKQRTLHTLHGKSGHEGNGPGGGHIEKGIKTEDPKQLKRKRQQRWPRSVECVIGTSKTNPMLDPYYW